MSIASIIATAGITAPLVLGGAYWLIRTLIAHELATAMEAKRAEFAEQLETHKGELAQALEDKKAALQGELAREKASVEGEVRRAIELELGQAAAEREYVAEARRRLYLAVGPLRFQLLLACRDCAGRIAAHGRHKRYRLDLAGYYGQSTLYRLLRPLAVAEMIERQIAYSDFSVDEGAIDCLRLKRTLVRIMSGDEIVCGHPNVNWNEQVEHAYADAAVVAACALIAADGDGERVMRFDEFTAAIAARGTAAFEPFTSLLDNLVISAKPILWVRLVAYAYACSAFLTRAGAALRFQPQEIPIAELIAEANDPFIQKHRAEYVAAIEANALTPL